MAWQIAITLGAIGALVLFHGARATEAPAAAEPIAAAPAPVAPAARDPWARVLVVAAVAAALLALGVIVVPAVTGDDEAASTTPTQPPTTTPPATTTAPSTTSTTTTTSTSTSTTAPTSTTTTKTTTIHLTTTSPTTTPATTPPAGSVLLVRATVQADGSAAQTVNRGQEAVVRRTATGQYRIRLPGMSDASRQRSTISVSAGPATAAVAGWDPDGALDVLLFDRKTGEPVSRRFIVGVSVPTLPPTR